jgi:hypothetical protein
MQPMFNRPEDLPGEIITGNYSLPMMPDTAMILWSVWGVEGVFTDAEILDLKYRHLRTYAAYKGESMSIQMFPLNPIV